MAGTRVTLASMAGLPGSLLTQTSPDSAFPTHVVLGQRRIDLNRPPYNAVPGGDILAALQQAVNDLFGTTTGQTSASVGSDPAGEIYFSQAGTYTCNTTSGTPAHSGSVAGGLPKPGDAAGSAAYSAQVVFPGLVGGSSVIGGSVVIRGPAKPVWSSANFQAGVVITSNVNGGDIFAVLAAGSGTYPALSHLHLRFEDVTLVNTNQNGGGIDAWSSGALQVHRSIVTNTTGGANGGINSTRKGIVFPHGTQNGDMVLNNSGVIGYLTGVQMAEHVYMYGWSSIVSCQNAFDFTSGGHANFIKQTWVSNCATILNASVNGVSGTAHIDAIIDWEGGSNPSRFVNDPFGTLSGSVKVHLSDQNGVSASSLAGTMGAAAGPGCPLDISILTGGPGWRAQHPVDSFVREVAGLTNADNPGFTSDTWHPWRVGSGAIAQDVVNGIISNANALTAASCFLPVKNARSGGESRAINVTCLLGSVYTGLTIFAHRNIGGTGALKAISVNLSGANVNLAVPGSGTVQSNTPTGRYGLASGNLYIVTPVIIVGADQLPTRARVLLAGVRIDTGVTTNGTTTVTDASCFAGDQGSAVTGTNVPFGTVITAVTPGVSFTTNNTIAAGTTTVTITTPSLEVCDHQLTATERPQFAPGAKFPYLEDGVQWSSTDVGSKFLRFAVSPVVRDDVITRDPIGALAQSGGGTLAVDTNAGEWQTITVSDATAFTVGTPANPPDSSLTQDLTVEVLNSSGGAMGAITFNGSGTGCFKGLTGITITSPASGKKRAFQFKWNGANWIYITQSVDY